MSLLKWGIVANINQILALQAGIIQGADGQIHIRGGRSNEIGYTVNGVSIVNPYDNSRSVDVAKNAIKELSVISGTFNAEYGNALSGIVNTVTKEGGKDFSVTASFYSGDYLIFATGRKPELGFLSDNLKHMQEELMVENRLFMVGDVNNDLYRQVSIAGGDGIRAAMAIHNEYEK